MAAQMLFEGKKLDYELLGKVYDPYDRIPEAKAKRVFRRKTVQDMLTEEILSLMKECGIDAKKVIEEEQELLNDCKQAKDNNNRLKVIERWGKRVQIDEPPKQLTTTTESISFTEMLNTGDKKKLELKREVEDD